MSRLAALLMFVAWLLYGAMPAVGMPSAMTPAIAMPTEQAKPVAQDHAAHHHDHQQTTDEANAEHSHGETPPACPHGDESCVTPFCAACLTLLPDLVSAEDGTLAYTYPAPGIEQVLAAPAPLPLTPPPRI